jgi:ankyrin repeat protein
LVDAVDSDGRTALHHAAITGDAESVGILVSAGALVSAADNGTWTPLHFAAQGYHLSIARALLDSGAAVDAVDEHGNTPLFRAVFDSRGRGEMISLLRQRGADCDRSNRHGISPRSLANNIANFDIGQWMR